VEVLVVAALLAMLASLLLPSLDRAREVARRGQCAGHLSQLGKAATAYIADTLNGEWLWITDSRGRGPHRIYLDVPSRGLAGGAPPLEMLNISSLPYLLVRQGCPTELFLCPGEGQEGAVAEEQARDRNGEYYWGFSDPARNCSYSFQAPHGPESRYGPLRSGVTAFSRPDLPILGDQNPGESSPLEDWAAPAGEREARRMNSPNHRGAWNNVLLKDFSVRSGPRADVGPAVGGVCDAIYSTFGSSPAQAARGSLEELFVLDARDGYLLGPSSDARPDVE
jgi:hypothetical protein